jgi:hypothetical protein
MCVPLAAVAIGTSIAGAGVSAYSAIKQGQDQKRYYDFLAIQNRSQAERAMAAAEEQAGFIQDTAGKNQEELDRQQRLLEGRQKTVLAKGGVWSTSKTAQDIYRDTETQAERDATALRFNANMESWQAKSQAAESARALREQAVGYGMAGSNARTASYWNTASSVLGSATNIADSWGRWIKAGG